MTDRTDTVRDDQLLRAWAADRDAAAFAELVRRHAGFVSAVATRALGADGHATDDVTQAVFILLSERVDRIHPHPSLRPWLHRATCYAASNARRMAGRRRRHERAAAVERPEIRMNHEPATIADDRLDTAINQLRTSDRELIISRYLDGMEDEDLAGVMKLSRATLQRRLSRALDRLRKHLGAQAPSTAVLPGMLAQMPQAPASLALQQQIIQSASHAATDGTVLAIAGLTRRSFEMAKWITAGKVVAATAIVVASCTGAVLIAQTIGGNPPAQAAAVVTTEADATAMGKQLQGRWRIVAWWKDGKPMPLDVLTNAEMRITGDRLEIGRPGGGSERGTFTLSAVGPRIGIDMRSEDGADRVVPGVISVDGNRLRIAFDGRTFKRPAGFMPDVESHKGMELERIDNDTVEVTKWRDGGWRVTVVRLEGKSIALSKLSPTELNDLKGRLEKFTNTGEQGGDSYEIVGEGDKAAIYLRTPVKTNNARVEVVSSANSEKIIFSSRPEPTGATTPKNGAPAEPVTDRGGAADAAEVFTVGPRIVAGTGTTQPNEPKR